MHETKLSQVDLNLLVGLDALLEVRTVTGAARKLGLSQSAMSHQLRRLRDLFGDALLVAGRGGMVATPRAEEIHGTVRRVLADVSRTIRGGDSFNPRAARHTFVIACRDSVEALGLPPMLDFISREAPGISIDSRPVGTNVLSRLEEGTVDLLLENEVESRFGPHGPGVRIRTISTDETVCLLRRGHPAACETLSLSAFAALRHVLVAPAAALEDSLEHRAAAAGVTLDVAARISNTMTAPFSVLAGDLAAVVPRRMANYFCSIAPLLVADLPDAVRSSTRRQMAWHERFEDDPPHRWLRGVVSEMSDAVNNTFTDLGPPSP